MLEIVPAIFFIRNIIHKTHSILADMLFEQQYHATLKMYNKTAIFFPTIFSFINILSYLVWQDFH